MIMTTNNPLHERAKKLALAAFAIKLKFSTSLQQKLLKFIEGEADDLERVTVESSFKSIASVI